MTTFTHTQKKERISRRLSFRDKRYIDKVHRHFLVAEVFELIMVV